MYKINISWKKYNIKNNLLLAKQVKKGSSEESKKKVQAKQIGPMNLGKVLSKIYCLEI